jgi:hypothetical protein
MKTLNDAIKQYRTLRNKNKTLSKKYVALKSKIDKVYADFNNSKQEIDNMKLLIDFCIMSNMTPAQALLSHDKDSMNAAMHAMVIQENSIFAIDTSVFSQHSALLNTSGTVQHSAAYGNTAGIITNTGAIYPTCQTVTLTTGNYSPITGGISSSKGTP